jgi:hypothetical protein
MKNLKPNPKQQDTGAENGQQAFSRNRETSIDSTCAQKHQAKTK